MDIRYDILFTIECLHQFFTPAGQAETNPLYTGLRFSPTPACRQLLRRYDLLFRETEGGMTVLYGHQSQGPTLSRIGEGEGVVLSFALIPTDPAFINITDLSLADDALPPAESLFYFQGTVVVSSSGAGEHGEEKKYLHRGKQVATEDQLPVRSSMFVYPVDPPGSRARVRVMDALSEKVVAGPDLPSEAARVVPVNLRDEPSGRYRLQAEGDEGFQDALDFYCTDVPPARFWGLVDVFVRPSPSAEAMARVVLDVQHPQPAASRVFTLSFENRKTFWKYFIVNQFREPAFFEAYEVVRRVKKEGNGTSPAQDVRFIREEDVEKVMQGTRRRVMVYASEAPLPLWHRPGERHDFTFKPGGAANGNGVTFALPYAAGNRLHPVRLKDGPGTPRRVYSEIFVYL